MAEEESHALEPTQGTYVIPFGSERLDKLKEIFSSDEFQNDVKNVTL